MEPVLKGIISGLVLAILVGPVFFTLIQTSIERGFVSGVYVALGISLSDAICIAIAYLGFSNLFTTPKFQVYLSYIGGIMLVLFGSYYLFIKSRKTVVFNAEHVQERSPVRLMAKGFVINGFNPMVMLFWIGTVSIATGKLAYTTHTKAIVFFCAIVGTVFITDVIKAKISDKLRLILTVKTIKVMNLIAGTVMLGFGLRLIFFH